jgi:small GTP-binding protein
MEQIPHIKVLVVGDSDIGKTCLTRRLVIGTWKESSEPTLTCTYYCLTLHSDSGKSFLFHLWDTAGQERYLSIAETFFRGANIALFCYALPDSKTLNSVARWRERVERISPDVRRILIGTKCDLGEGDQESARRVAQEMNAELIITSAVDGSGTEDLKKSLLESAMEVVNLRADQQLALRSLEEKSECC